MKHTYQITGMTCDGCRTKVEETLNAVTGITKATVSLPDSVEIEMDTHIATETMQKALSNAGNYTISIGNPTDKKTKTNEGNSCCGETQTTKNEGKTSCC